MIHLCNHMLPSNAARCDRIGKATIIVHRGRYRTVWLCETHAQAVKRTGDSTVWARHERGRRPARSEA